MNYHPGVPEYVNGSFEPSQSNTASIKQANFIIFINGNGGGYSPGSLSVFGDTFKFGVDENGDLTLNGKAMEASDLGNGLKMYTFKNSETY